MDVNKHRKILEARQAFKDALIFPLYEPPLDSADAVNNEESFWWYIDHMQAKGILVLN